MDTQTKEDFCCSFQDQEYSRIAVALFTDQNANLLFYSYAILLIHYSTALVIAVPEFNQSQQMQLYLCSFAEIWRVCTLQHTVLQGKC